MQINTVSTPTQTPSTSCLCQHMRQTTLLGYLCLTQRLRWQTPALLFIQNRTCVWSLSASSWRYTATEAQSFPCRMVLFSLDPVSLLGKRRCQLSFHPVCVTHLPDLFQSFPQPTYTVPPWTHCPFSLTLATCHWKESITLSAHSERAVKRPVGAIKAPEWRADFAPQTLKKVLLKGLKMYLRYFKSRSTLNNLPQCDKMCCFGYS